MQDDHSPAEPQPGADLARRKAILKGLGKTAAVAGAATPLTTLAGARLRFTENGKDMQCSVSGNHSVLMSGTVSQIAQCDALTATSYAYTKTASVNPEPMSWGDAPNNPLNVPCGKTNWPQWPVNGDSPKTLCKDNNRRLPTGTFAAIFGGGSATLAGRLLIRQPASDEAQWLTALLNAQRKYPASFPHSPAEVIAHYGSTQAAAALAFYKRINRPK